MENLDQSTPGTVYMNEKEMKEKAPSVFSKTPSNEVSKHYTHIPTIDVIRDMQALGWGVVGVKEVNARKSSTVGFQKHLAIFRNENIVINGEDGDIVYPQILMTNSHDGKNAFTFIAGLFRLICENGLVISTQEFENVKLRHMGYTFEDLQSKINEIVKKLPLTVECMNIMKEIELEQEMILDFAQKALIVRFGEKEIQNIKVDIDELITPTRKEDEGKNLWNIFNVLQEKLISGDFEYTNGVKIRKARKIKNFSQDQKLNQELFSLALEYQN